MPELPEVEVLVRYLASVLKGRRITRVQVFRPKVILPTTPSQLIQALTGCGFRSVRRRGKYLLFEVARGRPPTTLLIGHLGMTGRMYVAPQSSPLPKHTALALQLDRGQFVFEDTRYFGRFTLDTRPIERLGPEPLGPDLKASVLAKRLANSKQPIKIKLLDQATVAGIGNIYASEALFRAGICPRTRANRLSRSQIHRLWKAIRQVLTKAIEGGSTVPLDFPGLEGKNRLYYFGTGASPRYYEERLQVYDRAGKPCPRCGTAIARVVQAGRSTFWCPKCQRGRSVKS